MLITLGKFYEQERSDSAAISICISLYRKLEAIVQMFEYFRKRLAENNRLGKTKDKTDLLVIMVHIWPLFMHTASSVVMPFQGIYNISRPPEFTTVAKLKAIIFAQQTSILSSWFFTSSVE
jgi:hypothetical protein